jgi:hypothetical protein
MGQGNRRGAFLGQSTRRCRTDPATTACDHTHLAIQTAHCALLKLLRY